MNIDICNCSTVHPDVLLVIPPEGLERDLVVDVLSVDGYAAAPRRVEAVQQSHHRRLAGAGATHYCDLKGQSKEMGAYLGYILYYKF